MEKIVAVGPFNAAMRKALHESTHAYRFALEFIDNPSEYVKLEDTDYVILRTLTIDADQMKHLKKAKLIQRWGAGFDTVDIAEAGKRGIQVAVTVGMNATPVSEMTLALTLAVYRNLVPLTNGIQRGEWEREKYGRCSYTISGKTVGIYGIGSIGKKVARLYQAFDANVIYYDPYRLSREQELGVQFVSAGQLWQDADILTLHAPLTEDTRGIINAAVLAKMKDNAVLINTAREELVDCRAVAEALKSGKLLGVGLDAVDEPFLQHNPFAGMENVVLTAHLGGNTVDNAIHMARRCTEQILAVSHGERLTAPHLVNGQFLAM